MFVFSSLSRRDNITTRLISTVFVATAHASSYYVMGLMDRDIYRGFPENFGSRSIFLAHDYLTVYKNTSKLIV